MAITHPSNEQIATSWDLWREYVDPDGAVGKDEFDSLTVEQRIELIDEVWGD